MSWKKYSVDLVLEPLPMRWAFGVDGKTIWPDQATKRSKVADLCTAIVRREKEFIDTVLSLLGYPQAFEECYIKRIIDVCKTDMMEDIMISIFLDAGSRETYIRHVRTGRMMINHESMFLFLWKLTKDAPAAEIVVIIHLDDPSVYKSPEKDILLIMLLAEAFAINGYKPARSTQNCFTRKAAPLLMIFTVATCISTKRTFRPSRCFMIPRSSKPK